MQIANPIYNLNFEFILKNDKTIIKNRTNRILKNSAELKQKILFIRKRFCHSIRMSANLL